MLRMPRKVCFRGFSKRRHDHKNLEDAWTVSDSHAVSFSPQGTLRRSVAGSLATCGKMPSNQEAWSMNCSLEIQNMTELHWIDGMSVRIRYTKSSKVVLWQSFFFWFCWLHPALLIRKMRSREISFSADCPEGPMVKRCPTCSSTISTCVRKILQGKDASFILYSFTSNMSLPIWQEFRVQQKDVQICLRLGCWTNSQLDRVISYLGQVDLPNMGWRWNEVKGGEIHETDVLM